ARTCDGGAIPEIDGYVTSKTGWAPGIGAVAPARVTVTGTFPGLIPAGTLTVIAVSFQFWMSAVGTEVVPNATVPCVSPKPAPLTVTDAPGGPDGWDSPVIAGAGPAPFPAAALAPAAVAPVPK